MNDPCNQTTGVADALISVWRDLAPGAAVTISILPPDNIDPFGYWLNVTIACLWIGSRIVMYWKTA